MKTAKKKKVKKFKEFIIHGTFITRKGMTEKEIGKPLSEFLKIHCGYFKAKIIALS